MLGKPDEVDAMNNTPLSPRMQAITGRLFLGIFLLMIGLTIFLIGGVFHRDMQNNEREEAVLPLALPVLIAAANQPPEQARQTLSAVWDALQAVSPLTLTATEGGTRLHWDQIATSGCERLRQFLASHPEQTRRLTLTQNGAIIAPTGYADLSCGPGSKTTYSAFTFEPRLPPLAAPTQVP
jgi:hypothetical protein